MDLLLQLHWSRRTGILDLEVESGNRKFFFEQGAIVFLSSAVKAEKLPVRLVAKGRADKAAVLSAAKAGGDLRTALSAIRELVRIVELLAKVRGVLAEHQAVNVLVLPQWQRIETTILDVLGPHPELRTELAGRLRSLEAVSGS